MQLMKDDIQVRLNRSQANYGNVASQSKGMAVERMDVASQLSMAGAQLRHPLGSRIRELRCKKGLTLAQVAKAVGVSKPSVWAWEVGKVRPSERYLPRLCEVLGVSPEQISHLDLEHLGAEDIVGLCRRRIAEVLGVKLSAVRISIEL